MHVSLVFVGVVVPSFSSGERVPCIVQRFVSWHASAPKQKLEFKIKFGIQRVTLVAHFCAIYVFGKIKSYCIIHGRSFEP